jgi:hypothetical protein
VGVANFNEKDLTREKALTKRTILTDWAKSCLFLLNPKRVLRGLTKPDAVLTIEIPGGARREGRDIGSVAILEDLAA